MEEGKTGVNNDQPISAHPQAWLREKYAKTEKREKPKDEILFYKIYSKPLETPEDIKRYREERLKNYPTRKNIEKKQQEEAKKIERGDLIPKVEKQNKGKRKKNLINQLIEKEMNREKDCILQSLRFIVKNNFYSNNLSERVKRRLKDLQNDDIQVITEAQDDDDLKKKIDSIHEEIEFLESESENEEDEDIESDNSEENID